MTTYQNANGETIINLDNGFKISEKKANEWYDKNQNAQANRKRNRKIADSKFTREDYMMVVESGNVAEIAEYQEIIKDKYIDGAEWLASLN